MGTPGNGLIRENRAAPRKFTRRMLAEHGTPGVIVEHGPTETMFHHPQDARTLDYVNGRFG
jgi:ABC-type phosphate transport system ATPase subunit